jgi:hypothetical protein
LIFFAVVLILLAGCGTDTESSRTSSPLPAESEAVAGHPISSRDAYCHSVARQRANDAWANGYGIEVENGVSVEAYRNCIALHAGVSK